MFDINDDSNIKPIGLAQFRDQPKEKSIKNYNSKHLFCKKSKLESSEGEIEIS